MPSSAQRSGIGGAGERAKSPRLFVGAIAQMADKESAAGTNVQVAVRCRPLNAR